MVLSASNGYSFLLGNDKRKAPLVLFSRRSFSRLSSELLVMRKLACGTECDLQGYISVDTGSELGDPKPAKDSREGTVTVVLVMAKNMLTATSLNDPGPAADCSATRRLVL
ncbi:hypothetical protein AJ78_06954 [Emergomyces pasteurianus Ep9510]|uniref:Uncharacterized protein n=1 Tax=Emergomyces pasteurianus Ep9510 TaxID=1447872 RepID=A0A1J9P960_9EURO|nr:hypothetical protein AJ78_06954 [Emergomyces pasteurianus Ep9510]